MSTTRDDARAGLERLLTVVRDEPPPEPTPQVVITEPGIYQLDPITYHSDPTGEGSLSATSARKLLPPYAPAIYRWERDNPEQKDTLDFGKAAHHKVLGAGEPYKVITGTGKDPNAWRTNADTEAVEQARAEGLVPIKPRDLEVIDAMAAQLAAHPTAGRLFDPDRGRAEQSLFWRINDLGIWRRCRVDFLPNKIDGRRLIVPDYKTTAGLPYPLEWAKSAANFGYHMQAAAIIEGLQALGVDDDPAVIFVVQSKTAPYLVTVAELYSADLTIGRNLNRAACRIFAECQRSGQWPGYSPEVHLVQLPAWYRISHDEEPEEGPNA